MQKPQTIIFDWDGTLHESIVIYYPALLKSVDYLKNQGYTLHQSITQDDVKHFIGMNPKDMWRMFMPGLEDDVMLKASQIISDAMLEAIEKNQAQLYPHAREVLQALKNKGYTLIYLSNSKNYYMETMRKAFQLDQYFDEMICSEMYHFLPKKDILAHIKSRLKQPMVMIGDRYLDIETGQSNGAITIGCAYGYGHISEFKDADHVIHDLKEILTIL